MSLDYILNLSEENVWPEGYAQDSQEAAKVNQ